jgi:hypothetical protein
MHRRAFILKTGPSKQSLLKKKCQVVAPLVGKLVSGFNFFLVFCA